MTHPAMRFLGVSDPGDRRALLGLDEPVSSLPQIDAALRRQLARVHKHPDGMSAEGEKVRAMLRDAAEQLKRQVISARRCASEGNGARPEATSQTTTAPMSGPRRPAASVPPPPRPSILLTPFDRAVLAVLVGCGGWNAECRSRLVAIASLYGVSVQGLIRVITGLSNYARSGGARLGVAEIAGDQARISAPTTPSSDAFDETSDLLTRLLPEFREDSLWSRMKLIALFSVVTLIAGLLFLRVLIASPSPHATATVTEPPAVVDQAPAPKDRAAADIGAEASRTTSLFGPATFDDRPTFLGAGVPMIAADAADQSPQIPGHLDEVARKITVADEPSEAVYRNWDESIGTAASGWLLSDEATRESIRRTMFDALFAASQQPTVSDRLLSRLTPPSGRLAEPIDVVRGAWMAGTLGQIASANLPPVVRQRAQEQLRIALDRPVDQGNRSFDSAAQAWLLRSLPRLTDRMTYDRSALDYWELWLAAVRHVAGPADDSGRSSNYNDALLRALTAIVTTGPQLTIDNVATKIVGRLLSLMNLEADESVRTELISLFEDERVSSQDLWIITSILVQYEDAPWMSHELVLPGQADVYHRRRIAAKWQERWPAPSPGLRAADADAPRLLVDSELFKHWTQLQDTLSRRADGESDAQRIGRIVAISMLNEAAAALYRQDVAQAERLLDEVSDLIIEGSSADASPQTAPSPTAPSAPPIDTRSPGPVGIATPRGQSGTSPSARRPGQALGVDGEWAALYEQVQRNTTEKLNLLNALRNSAGTDLGPIDARVFVGEVYRGAPQEVRAVAQSVLIEQFEAGPTVAMEMLDQSIHAPSSSDIGECIARYTGAVLPPTRVPSFDRDARLALVEHALSLQPLGDSAIDHGADLLHDSYIERSRHVSRAPLPTLLPDDPAGAAAMLRDAWQRLASMLIATKPMPDDLPGLSRRHDVRMNLASGPVQQFAANQIAIVELLAYVTTAERPTAHDAVAELLDASGLRRDAAASILQQSLEAEFTMSRLWRIRMAGTDRDDESAKEVQP